MRHGAALAALFLLAGGRVSADTADSTISNTDYTGDTVHVTGRRADLLGVAVSASQIQVDMTDLALRPLLREGELLETNPGMIVTQHSGDGKSNQMFLRGFNLDHGTDFATWVGGMPVNLPTHGHGQGYTDLNFLIPELVHNIRFNKGTYYAQTGDFSSAGWASLELATELPKAFFKAEGGTEHYRRAVMAASGRRGSGAWLFGAEVKGYDGPWTKPQDLKKASALASYKWHTGGGDEFLVRAMAYDNSWESSDQIPARAVSAGTLGRFDQVDSTLGGESSRYSLSGSWKRPASNGGWQLDVYGVLYELNLFSNFSYFAGDSVNGDQIEQVDRRTVLGGQLGYHGALGAQGGPHSLSAGLQVRTDLIPDVALHHTQARERFATVRADEVTEIQGAVFASVSSKWTSHVRTELGLRTDYYHFDVDSKLQPLNSGTASEGIVSPKLGLALGPWGPVEVYANAGLGFHSNDARGTTIQVDPETGDPVDKVDPLVPSKGAEVGMRVGTSGGWRSTLAGWYLDLESELLFVGDAGTTEPTGESRRIGVELSNFYQITRNLTADLDLAFTKARYVDAAPDDRIPGALENVVAAGLSWDQPGGLFGAVRVRHLGHYPLIEDNSVRAEATTMLNLGAGYRFWGLSVGVEVMNLLDEEANDIQYYYGSRLTGETALETEDIHFHPVEPREYRLVVSYNL